MRLQAEGSTSGRLESPDPATSTLPSPTPSEYSPALDFLAPSDVQGSAVPDFSQTPVDLVDAGPAVATLIAATYSPHSRHDSVAATVAVPTGVADSSSTAGEAVLVLRDRLP